MYNQTLFVHHSLVVEGTTIAKAIWFRRFAQRTVPDLFAGITVRNDVAEFVFTIV